MSEIKTKCARVLPDMHQPTLAFAEASALAETAERNKFSKVKKINFLEGNSKGLFVGDKKLEFYLQESGFSFVLQLCEYLKEYDFSEFIKSYSPTGRRAIHPRIMLGLIIYGILNKQWSLRQLQALARRDVGAWWVCGGLQPDHSTIGNFFTVHAKLLSEDFFITFTQQIVHKLKLTSHDVAGDGTTIEAASSHFRVLRAEAAELAAEKLAEEAASDPQDKKKEIKAQLALEASNKAKDRREVLKKYGKPSNAVCVSPVEPDATVQPLKNKINRPSYKPSILVDQNRLIIGQYLHSTSENLAIKPMLEHHKTVYGDFPRTTLLDAGYHTIDVLNMFATLELDVLCPSGSVDKTGKWNKESHHQIGKIHFKYDENKDVYICPEKNELTLRTNRIDAKGRKFKHYEARACLDCPSRANCTKSKKGRSIKRYEGEDVKEAMAQVLKNTRAKQKYRRRKVMVEPVFSDIKERQDLKRFHRKGLQKVKLEFALHCIVYNIKRAIKLEEGLFILFIFYWRQNGGTWKIHSFYFMYFPM